jgi:signal transduction histidine kinase/tetratricopeptide (TPR) repeat protein
MRVITISLFLAFCTLQLSAQENTILYIDSITSSISSIQNDTVKARMYKAIAEKCLVSLPQQTLIYANKGLQLATKMEWQKGIAVFNDIIGQHYSNKGNGDSAIYFYEKAYQIDIKNGLNINAASTLNNIGVVYQNQANYEKATTKFSEALQIAEKENIIFLIAICNQNIGQIYMEQGNFQKCIEIYKKVIKLHEQDKNIDGVASAYSSIAGTYVKMNDTINANYYFNKAIEIFKKSENFLELATAYSDASIIEKDIAKRIEIKLKAQKIWNEYSPSHLSSSTNLSNLGLEYFNIVRNNLYDKIKGNPAIPQSKKLLLDKAKQYYSLALKYSYEQNFVSNIANQNGLLAELEAYMGDYKNAFEHYEIYTSLKDSIYSQDNKNKIATIIGKREVLLRDKEIEVNKKAISVQKKQNIGLVIGLFILSLIGLLLYKQSQARKRTNTKLNELNTKLNEANSLKAKFFAIISHDLRSPIANLINFLHLQKNAPEVLDEDIISNYNDKIITSTEQLLENMETLLIWSKGQMEQFKPEFKEITVESLFSFLKSNFNTYSNINFEYKNAQNLSIYSDINILQVILQNLTNNAIKALDNNLDNKIIWEASLQKNDIFTLSITDTGKGLSKKQIDALLLNDNFSIQKNGLGFFIIKDLAKTIGFEITIESIEGSGTTIILQ